MQQKFLSLRLFWKYFMTSKQIANLFYSIETTFAWRTRNVWCIELIPAELEDFTETVSDVVEMYGRVFQIFLLWLLETNKRNHVQVMNDVGTISWNCHNLHAPAQHVLIIIHMTLLRVNDKKMSSIQHYISLEEENRQDSSVI